MRPVGDDLTASYLGRVLGDEQVPTRTTSRGPGDHRTSVTNGWRPKAPPNALQQLGGDRAILVEGHLPPAVIKLMPWWEDRELRARAPAAARR